ncbi:FemAB family XrtA/PEP-CTERM system-associated protein [Colwellia piezophila]|uniref:FemAB family XrtA/PEP-CTERM system-associated protein n=1 Tax=Colwellia piezophila TaxID=211668 RepID=UPI00035EDC37|nr:FemAB family XrtA/PEP-CTERM system-associated protein [Colwellia piezophila]
MANNNSVVKRLTPSEFESWDHYVKNHQYGSFFHLSGWQQVITKSFNHGCYFFYVEQAGKICGILPLVEVKSKFFGHALISTPFCVYGGAIADTPELVRQLEHQACQLAEKLSVDYLELRYQYKQDSSLLLKQGHSTFGCELPGDSDKILASIKKKQRAVIRHSLNNELSFTIESGGAYLEDFYFLLSVSYRNLGTPVFCREYFNNLVDVFGDKVDIAIIKNKDNQLSSAVMNYYFNEQVLPFYYGGVVNARSLKSADFMYYQLMCHASNKGYRWYDFGRSKNDSGAYKYKKNWGMKPKLLYYYYYLVNATELPNLSPNNPKYKLLIQMWRKLPLKVSQFIGPFLSKFLG